MSYNSKHGEVSWDEEPKQEKKSNSQDLFLRLDDGENEIRLLTLPYQYLVHKYKKEGDPGYGNKISCSAAHGHCPVCDLGDKAKQRWFLGVIDRKTNSYKILDVSWAVYSQIKKLNSGKWGDPTKYDVSIIVDRKGGATGYYTVQPVEKSPLSVADQRIKDEKLDLADLKRRASPPTPDVVQKRLDSVLKNSPPTKVAGSVSEKPSVSTDSSEVSNSSIDNDDDDEGFPSYDD